MTTTTETLADIKARHKRVWKRRQNWINVKDTIENGSNEIVQLVINFPNKEARMDYIFAQGDITEDRESGDYGKKEGFRYEEGFSYTLPELNRTYSEEAIHSFMNVQFTQQDINKEIDYFDSSLGIIERQIREAEGGSGDLVDKLYEEYKEGEY